MPDEDDDALMQALDFTHELSTGGDGNGDGGPSQVIKNGLSDGDPSGASHAAGDSPIDSNGDPSLQFVPSQHSAFCKPLSRPIAKKPSSVAVAPAVPGGGHNHYHGFVNSQPSPQHVASPNGSGAHGHPPLQHQHQLYHSTQHQQQQQQQSFQFLQFPTHPQPQQVKTGVHERKTEGILQDALHSNVCSKKEIEIFSHHFAKQRMTRESIKNRLQQQQNEAIAKQIAQRNGQTSSPPSSSPDGQGLQGSSIEQRRSKRSRTDQSQYQQLEEVFLQDPLPSRKTKERLAQELGLTHRKVQVWFQNRRAKERRQLREMGINDSEVLPNPWGE